MVNKIKNTIHNFEKITHTIMNNGLKFCFGLCLASLFLLLVYDFFITSPFLYAIGINLFRLSLIFGIEFIVCAFVTDGIKKQLV